MTQKTPLYEGKAKVIFKGPEDGTLIQHFKDDATAFNAEKKDVIDGKGVLNNRLSEFFMTGLNAIGIPTHLIKRINMREQLIRAVEIVPLEVIVRNYAAGTLVKRLGLEEGVKKNFMANNQNDQEFLDDLMGPPEESFFFRGSRGSFGIGFFVTIRGREYRFGIGAESSRSDT